VRLVSEEKEKEKGVGRKREIDREKKKKRVRAPRLRFTVFQSARDDPALGRFESVANNAIHEP